MRAGCLRRGRTLAFLSLGQVVPMVSFLPDAQRLRADLQYLCESGALTWVDVTAPGDGCAFALCDPVAVSGVAPAGKRWPLVMSAAFTQTLSPERWKALRWRFFRLHFQYLCAFDRPGDYDYFAHHRRPHDAGRALSWARAVEIADRPGRVGPCLGVCVTALPPKPAVRPDKVSLWRYMRLFRQDILSAQPARLYRAWMAEFRTPFFRSLSVQPARAGAAGPEGAAR